MIVDEKEINVSEDSCQAILDDIAPESVSCGPALAHPAKQST